ncbi:MAG: acyltransferase [Planctomycetota bacterium]|nr:acyltransferase [Planctomycetota bacterium]
MLDALTGLRFIAAFAVFMFHSKERFHVDSWKLGSLGSSAVAFFFVLSGFILTYVYGDTLSRDKLRAFFVARFARIWPVHAVTLVLFIWIFRGASFPVDGREVVSLVQQALLLQTWSVEQAQIFQFNGVSWSISVEFFFYALFPFVCFLSRKAFLRAYGLVALGTILMLVVAEVWVRQVPGVLPQALTVFHLGPPTRLFEFMTGIAAARWFAVAANARRNVALDTSLEVGSLALAAGAFYVANFTPTLYVIDSWFGAAVMKSYLCHGPVYALPFAAVVVVFARSRGLLARLFSLPGFVYLGEISYAFYMVHSIVILAVVRFGGSIAADWQLGILASFALTLAASTILHEGVELPFRDAFTRLLMGRPKEALPSLGRGLGGFARNSAALASVVLLVVAPIGIARVSAIRTTVVASECIGRTLPRLRDITFENEARILGVGTRRKSEGLELSLVLEPLPKARRDLFLHISDGAGNVLRQSHFTFTPLRDERGRELQLASALLTKAELEGATTLGVGFWSKEAGAAGADRGPLSMGGHRLDVYRIGGRRMSAMK